ncbi:PAS domain S-box protein [Desulfococcus sp.]|uniref:PAS domain-containing sensor histidine kinase n=1 Tax=Desulfococcus sp. TaxID=2025834 RepID=UPI00359343EC
MREMLDHPESWYRLLFETTPDAILVLDEETRRFEAVNGSAEDLFGLAGEKFLAMTAADILAVGDPPWGGDSLRRGPEIRILKTGGGAVFTGEISAGGFVSEGRAKIVWIVRDITERVRRDESIRKKVEQPYRSVLDNIAIGATLISPDMRILTLNKQMKRWYPRVDFSGEPLCYRSFNDPPGEKVCSYCPVIKTLRDGQVHESVAETPSGGGIRYFRIISSPVKDDDGRVQAAIEMVEDITGQKQAERQIQNLSQQLLNAQENERLMISNELHDTLAQDLSTVKISLEFLAGEPSALPPDTRQTIAHLGAVLGRSILSVRNLSYDLRPPGLKEIGLIETLASYCDEFEEETGITAKFYSAGLKGRPMDPFLEINIYRLVQEGLNNIRKHAGAGRAVVRLVGVYPNVILRIEDDGRGFDAGERGQPAGGERRMGISSMTERVNLLMGRMEIRSRPGEGTRIFIKFPFRDGATDPERR